MACGSVKIGTTEVLVTWSTSWWVPGRKVRTRYAIKSVATSAPGGVSGTLQMSHVWRKYERSSSSCQKALMFLS